MNLQASVNNGVVGTGNVRQVHVMTVDVEDYFMVEAFSGTVRLDSWNSWPSRVVNNTKKILDLFDRYEVKGTFFMVGWVAEKFPSLVRAIHDRGHELACHSYWHRTVYSLRPDEFRQDTRAAVRAIEDAAGVRVLGYRAPSWSITKSCLWALDILAEEGFTYDSSIYPIRHDLYGVPGAQRFPYDMVCKNGKSLREFPPTTVRLFGQNLPCAGGGYLRIFPMSYTNWVFRKFERDYGERVVVYVHPWEIDPEQPRIEGKLKSRFRHYTLLSHMEQRLETLLRENEFTFFSSILETERVEARLTLGHDIQSDQEICDTGPQSPEARTKQRPDRTDVKSTATRAILAGNRTEGLIQNRSTVLTYHAIESVDSPSTYTLSAAQLEGHLRLVGDLERRQLLPPGTVLFTFDDGYSSDHVHAAPLLEKCGRRGIFFIVTSLVGSSPNYMNWSEIKDLASRGHEIQSHSWSHPLLTQCSDQELAMQLVRSKSELEDRLGTEVDAFGVPGGRWDKRVLRWASHAGYRRFFVSDPSIGCQVRSRMQIRGRVTVKRAMSADNICSLLTGRGYYAKTFLARFKSKELVRRLVGDRIYKRAWKVVVNR